MGSALLSLNAVLLRSTVTPVGAFSREVGAAGRWYQVTSNQAEETEVDDDLLQAAIEGDQLVLVVERPTTPPPWQRVILEAVDSGRLVDVDLTRGAGVFCAVRDNNDDLRWILYTFGTVSHSLLRNASEPRFGLLAALNRLSDSSEPSLLRQAQHRSTGAHTFNAGFRSSRDTPLEAFGFDRLADILAAAGGRTDDDDPATHVFGSRSLRTKETVNEIGQLTLSATRAINDYARLDYQAEFAFVDNIIPIDDTRLEQQLRTRLAEEIGLSSPFVDILLPDDVVRYEDERAIAYIAFPREKIRSASHRVLTMDLIKNMMASGNTETLDSELRFLDGHRHKITTVPLVDCLAAEIDYDENRYVLYDGDFYCVKKTFLDQVNEAVADLPISKIELPSYAGGPENDWVLSVSRTMGERFVALDGELIRPSGESAFEPCDLIDVKGSLIHAKRKSRSSSMSHLFVQAQRSCELLTEVPDARLKLAAKLKTIDGVAPSTRSQADALISRLAERDHGLEVVLAILGDWKQANAVSLPLLAKISLIGSVRSLHRSRFRPSVALVPLASRNI